jgi:hypothetical protein
MAEMVINKKDPIVANLLALAVEFEAKAVALTAEEATETQIRAAAGPDGSSGERQ